MTRRMHPNYVNINDSLQMMKRSKEESKKMPNDLSNLVEAENTRDDIISQIQETTRIK